MKVIEQRDDIKEATFKDGDMVMVDRAACDSPTTLFKCSGGGFGSSPNSGGKMYGTFVSSGTEGYVRRSWVVRWANDDDIQEAEEWRTSHSGVIAAEVCNNKTARLSRDVEELCNDEASRVSKDQLRYALLQLHCTLLYVNETLQGLVTNQTEAN